MGTNNNGEEKQGAMEELKDILTKENKIRLLAIAGCAVVLYLIFPLVLQMFSDEIRANWELLRLLLLNQIFIGVVGWQANYFKRFGIYIPLFCLIFYVLSGLVIYGQLTWTMEIEYMQTGYIVFFLRKFLARRMAINEKKNNKPFPRSVTGKK